MAFFDYKSVADIPGMNNDGGWACCKEQWKGGGLGKGVFEGQTEALVRCVVAHVIAVLPRSCKQRLFASVRSMNRRSPQR